MRHNRQQFLDETEIGLMESNSTLRELSAREMRVWAILLERERHSNIDLQQLETLSDGNVLEWIKYRYVDRTERGN